MTVEELVTELKTPGSELYAILEKLVRNGVLANTTAVLQHEGVLTVGNFGQAFRNDPNVYQRIADTAYEADTKVEAAEPHP